MVLNIENIDTQNCYREFGKFASAQIKRGKVVIENGESKIDNLLLVAKSFEEGFDDIIVESKAGATLPTLDRTDVEIASTGTLVVNIVTPSTDEYIYLTKAGVVEQIVVKEASEIPAQTKPKDVSVNSTEANVEDKSTTTQTAAEQIANIGKKNEAGTAYVDADGNDISLENLTSENIVVEEAKASETKITTGTTLFSGGAGTEKSPYLIATSLDFFNINYITYSSWNTYTDSTKGYKFKLVNDINLNEGNFLSLSGRGYKVYKFYNCALDGNGHTLSINDNKFIFYDIDEDSVIKNLTIEYRDGTFSSFAWYCGETRFENVKTIGELSVSNNSSAFMIFGWSGDLTFIDCENYANITAEGATDQYYNGVFIGQAKNLTNVYMTRCYNYGVLTAGRAGFIVGNDNTSTSKCNYYLNDCYNFGTLRSLYVSSNFNPDYYRGISSYGKIYVNNELVTDYSVVAGGGVCVNGPSDTIAVSLNEDKTFTFTKSNLSDVAYYKVSLIVAISLTSDQGGSGYYMVSEIIEANGSENYTSTLKKYGFTSNNYSSNGEIANNKIVKNNDVNYYFVDNDSYYISGTGITYPNIVSVTAYDENGKVLSNGILELSFN